MNGWYILGSIYLAIGVAAGFVITSREAIDYYRSIPSIRRDEEQVGPFLFGMSILIAALLIVVAWPVAFMGDWADVELSGGEDSEFGRSDWNGMSCDFKRDNFGMLDGRVVLLDYGEVT